MLDSENELESMIQEMLDYLNTPYFSSLLLELFQHSFQEYKDLVSLNFKEEEIAYHKLIALLISLR